jgi:hypothetical protein
VNIIPTGKYMGNTQATKKKKPHGRKGNPSGELPLVECKRMATQKPAFEWNLTGLTGSLDAMKTVLKEKLLEINRTDRERASIDLLEANGSKLVKSASLMAIKAIDQTINLGTIVQKVFKGRNFEECMEILEGAGITLDNDSIEKLRRYFKERIMDNSLYHVRI